MHQRGFVTFCTTWSRPWLDISVKPIVYHIFQKNSKHTLAIRPTPMEAIGRLLNLDNKSSLKCSRYGKSKKYRQIWENNGIVFACEWLLSTNAFPPAPWNHLKPLRLLTRVECFTLKCIPPQQSSGRQLTMDVRFRTNYLWFGHDHFAV